MPGRAAGRTSNTGFRCCASACRSRRRWRTGSTATPRACLVLGRHPKALRRLGRLFAEGQVEKVYWAVVAGVPRESRGPHRGRAREAAARHGRLAHGGGPGRAAGGHRLSRARRRGRAGLARTAGRAPGARTRSACIAPRSAARSSATRPMAGRPITRCSCTRARSRCRSIRRSRRSRSPRRCRRTCLPLLTALGWRDEPDAWREARWRERGRRSRCAGCRRKMPRCSARSAWKGCAATRMRSAARSRRKADQPLSFFADGWLPTPCSAPSAAPNLLGVAGFMSSPVRSTATRARCGACMSARRRAAPGSAARLVEAVIEHARAARRADPAHRHQRQPGRRAGFMSGSALRNTGSKSAPRNIAAAIMTMC